MENGSNQIKIIVADKATDSTIKELGELGVVEYLGRLDEGPEKVARLTKALSNSDHPKVLYIRSATKVYADLLMQSRNLKVVARAGTGLDGIDLPTCQKMGIEVLRAAGANAPAVTEFVIAQTLNMLRPLDDANRSMKLGQWNKKELVGREFGSQTIGIIGCGDIGQKVANIAAAFGTHVLGYDPKPRDNSNITYVSMTKLLDNSDIITINAELNQHTRNLVGKEQFAMMKEGVLLIHASRGGIVDEQALYDACESGKVGKLALDVYSIEPLTDEARAKSENIQRLRLIRRLIALPTVRASPHIGGSTKEAEENCGKSIVSQLRAKLPVLVHRVDIARASRLEERVGHSAAARATLRR